MSQSRLQRALTDVSLTASSSDDPIPVPSVRLLIVTTSHSSPSTLYVASPTIFSSRTAANPSSSAGYHSPLAHHPDGPPLVLHEVRHHRPILFGQWSKTNLLQS